MTDDATEEGLNELERLRAEARAAREEAEAYRALLDAASDAVFVYDADTGRVLDVNATMLQMYGVTREEALADRSGADPTEPDSDPGEGPYAAADTLGWLARAAHEGPQVFEWVARARDGRPFPVEVGLSVADLPSGRRVVAVVRDVTRRKEIEDALGYRVRFERLVADISNRFVSVKVEDVDQEIEFAIGEVARFTGANAGYVLQLAEEGDVFVPTHLWSDGRTGLRKEHLRDLPRRARPCWLGRALDEELVAAPSLADLPGAAAHERALFDALGGRALIDVPLTYQGRVLGYMGFVSTREGRAWNDSELSLLRFAGQVFISTIERSRGELALRQSEEQLLHAQKMDAIGRLAGGVAHDFNNLLTVVTGYAELLLAGLEEGDPMRRDVAEIHRAGQRGESLTRQLLAFSRKQVGAPRVVELDAVVERARAMLGRVIPEDVELSFEPGAAEVKVRVDPAHLEQILLNLATNAGDAMPSGGKLRLSTRRQRCSAAFARQHGGIRGGTFGVLAVRDTGAGIAPEDLAQIFEPFFTTKPRGKGTGLGLSTVYGLARQYDGFVSAESRPGEGATFRLYLPEAHGSSEMGGGEPAVEEPVSGRARILLVEDEVAVRELAARVLRRQGYELVVAEDSLDACRRAEAGERFDLLLTDVVMPQLKGPEVFERVRVHQPDLRCLYMSGYADEVVVRHGATDAGWRLLRKPFTLSSLTRAVESALSD